jgi:hypothetical protein
MGAVNGSNGSVILERLKELLPDAVFLPIREREKRPRLPAWQTVDLARSRKPGYQKMLESPAYPNTGVLLGEPSGNLCTIDLDSDEAAKLFLALNPELRETLRSKGKRGCQIWLKIDGSYPHQVHKLKDKAGQLVGEWRASGKKGQQSVIRGVHPDGMHYQLLVDSKPLEIVFTDIRWPSEWAEPWLEKDKTEAEPSKHGEDGQDVPPDVQLTEKLDYRIREYLKTADPAIDKQHGHDTTFRIACALVWGFGIDPQDAFQYFQEYNQKCQPPWSEKELWHKLEDALNAKDHTKDRGHLLKEKEKKSTNQEDQPNPSEPGSQEDAKNDNQEPPPGAEPEPPKDEWAEAIRNSACTSAELRKMKLVPRKAVVADFFKCADLGFIYGPRGLGKSLLGHYLSRSIATGTPCGPWLVYQKMRVLYVDGEMPIDDVRNRDVALGSPCENLFFLNHELLFEKSTKTLNIADEATQEALTNFCLEQKAEVLVLDNLSALSFGVDENKGIDWEKLLRWLLDLRRRGISVVFIHHAGRSGEMRGHSKREDPAFWIIRLDPADSDDEAKGAKFISKFDKHRNSMSRPTDYEWHFKPNGKGGTDVKVKEISNFSRFRQLVRAGETSATKIAQKLGIGRSYVSKLAERAQKEGWLEIEDGKYHFAPGPYKTGKQRKQNEEDS